MEWILTIPSKQDIAKKKQALDDHLKSLTDEGKLTEKKLVSMLRSAIRQVWMRAPNKLAKLEMARIPDMNPNTRTKWLFRCEMCGKLFKQDQVEIDHRFGNHTFTKLEDFENFCDKILNASVDDLQVLCKVEHSIKTLAEARGITFEEALIEKEVIAFGKKKVDVQKKILLELDPTSKVNNATVRKSEYRRLLKETNE